jgi:hypothetical protein
MSVITIQDNHVGLYSGRQLLYNNESDCQELTYYDKYLITAVKGFTSQALGEERSKACTFKINGSIFIFLF